MVLSLFLLSDGSYLLALSLDLMLERRYLLALSLVLLFEGGYLVINLAHLFLADIQTSLKLGLHCIEDSFEAGRVFGLDLVNIAVNAVMTFVYFSEALALAAFANHLCIYTFFCHMDQMCFETLKHFAAVIDARRLLNIA